LPASSAGWRTERIQNDMVNFRIRRMSQTSALHDPRCIALLRRHNLLRSLVQREVVADAVAGEQISTEERQQARSSFLKRNKLSSEEGLAKFLRDNGLSRGDLDWQMELPLRIRQHALGHFSSKAEARFLKRKNELDRVVYSLLRVRDGFLARELYLRLAASEANFADLAASFAEGPERDTKGIVGPVPLTRAHPILAEKLRTTRPGVLMEPFSVEDWWLVVRLERYTPARFDDAMAFQMASELFEEWVNQETIRKLRQLDHEPEGAPTAPA
jgi:parvulin-like peptidyl-prolyl isomerase